MPDALPAQLKAIDVSTLADVVRQDQRSPAFEITEWSVRRLSDKGAINPDGLWLVSGQGHDGGEPRPWSVVVKIFGTPAQDLPPDDMRYWKRELLVAQSGVLAQLPGPVRAPRFYRAKQQPDAAWLWMEHIETDRHDAWALDDYSFAAHQLGRWNGLCSSRMPLAEPWLARQHYRSWLRDVDPAQDWRFPLHQKHLGDTRRRYQRLWAERERFYRALEALPQSFGHFDSQRRNLFVRKNPDAQNELVLVDWALCGLGPLGAELSAFVGMSGIFLEWPPDALPELDSAAFASYLQGLYAVGWSGDADHVRLGYVAWLAISLGGSFPSAMATWCSASKRASALGLFGLAEEALYLQWLAPLRYALDCADEARRLMRKLGMA